MESFFLAVIKGDECKAAGDVVTSAKYLELLFTSCLIICDLANPDDYRIDVITHFGSRDIMKGKTLSFGPEQIRDLGDTAKRAGFKYETANV